MNKGCLKQFQKEVLSRPYPPLNSPFIGPHRGHFGQSQNLYYWKDPLRPSSLSYSPHYFTDDEMEASRGNDHKLLYFLQGKTLPSNTIKTESINTEFKQHHLNLID